METPPSTGGDSHEIGSNLIDHIDSKYWFFFPHAGLCNFSTPKARDIVVFNPPVVSPRTASAGTPGGSASLSGMRE